MPGLLGIPTTQQLQAMEEAVAKHITDLEKITADDAQSIVAKALAAAQADIRTDIESIAPKIAEALDRALSEISLMRLVLSRLNGATITIVLGPEPTVKSDD